MEREHYGWRGEYELGFKVIDDQHRSLIGMIDNLRQAVADCAGSERLLQLVHRLEFYTLAHFTAEEAFMQVTGFPARVAHKATHQEFVRRLSGEKISVAAGNIPGPDLLHSLHGWLVNHITVTDREYAGHVCSARNEIAARSTSMMARLFKRFF